MFEVLGSFRRIADGIQELNDTIRIALTLLDSMHDNRPALDRLEELERSRALFEVEMESVLMKAEGKLHAASNAEARTRTMKKSYEKLLDPFDADSEEGRETIREGTEILQGYAEPSEADRLQPVRLELAPNNKAHAMRAKWLT